MKAAIAILCVLLATGCGTESESGESPSGDARRFPGGQTLAEYRDSPTYEWRVNIVDEQAGLLRAMRRVAPGLDESDLRDVVSTCDAIARGISGQQLVRESVTRFSGSEQVSPAQARRLVEASRKYACPNA